ncbi:MAG: nitroreductase family protein [Desulfovibrio sp.]|jgi:Fe-S-cluster-containing hydrogenase component 2|nr:nitroreductase family protein [Desulfovibrio sp.]
MTNLNFTVDAEKCTHCGACERDCPSGIIRLKNQLPLISKREENSCLQCEHCLAVCPTGAISIFGHDPAVSIPLASDSFPNLQSMETLVRGRRSVRQYRQDDVPSDLIKRLLADLANSPTGCNARALSFLLSDKRELTKTILGEVIEALEKRQADGAALPEFLGDGLKAFKNKGDDWIFRGAPHFLIVTADKDAPCAREDVILALAYFEMLANCAGLGACWCGILSTILEIAPEFRSRLGIAPAAPFYTILFGLPAVRYARTVQRDSAAVIRRIGDIHRPD